MCNRNCAVGLMENLRKLIIVLTFCVLTIVLTISSVIVFLKSKFNNFFFAKWDQAMIVTAIAA